jgi:hypothetical protein
VDRFLTYAKWRREEWKAHGTIKNIQRVLAYAEAHSWCDTPRIFELTIHADGTASYGEISPQRFAEAGGGSA